MIHQISRYEAGLMKDAEVDAFFQQLVDTGILWELQGSYALAANRLALDGRITIH